MIEIVEPGPLATVQDLGRPGWAALGVPRSGAFDRSALRLANRLVGNREDAAGIEVMLGGLAVRMVDAATIALTGTPCPGPLDWSVAVSLPAGATLQLGPPPRGLRSYLAVRGGVLVEAVLGSASTDTLSGLGPGRLRRGQLLEIGRGDGDVSGAHAAAGGVRPALEVRLGPRDDWFTASALSALTSAEWTVRADSDRVGIRLDGPALERAVTGELPSEAVLPGAIQVPGSGRPIIFGPDAPVTGGYPVIAVLRDLGPAAQLRPGDPVRFSLTR